MKFPHQMSINLLLIFLIRITESKEITSLEIYGDLTVTVVEAFLLWNWYPFNNLGKFFVEARLW